MLSTLAGIHITCSTHCMVEASLHCCFTFIGHVLAGPCARCEVVCTDPALGRRTGPEPLLTLASFRRHRGRILFGILLEADAQAPGSMTWLSMNTLLQVNSKAGY